MRRFISLSGLALLGVSLSCCGLVIGIEEKEITVDGLGGEAAQSGGNSSRSGGASNSGGDSGSGGTGVSTGGSGSGGTTAAVNAGKELISCQGLTATCSDDEAGCCSLDLVSSTDTYQGRLASGKDYNPERALSISPFYLGRYEVTVGRFRKFEQAYAAFRDGGHPAVGEGEHPSVADSGWQSAWDSLLPASLPSTVHDCSADWSTRSDGTDEFPMNCVSWHEAMAFCIWDGGRLPTEAEWEYAAMGADERRSYPWGSATPVPGEHAAFDCFVSNACQSVGKQIDDFVAVGTLPAGEGRFGHMDLAGNVSEWVLDIYKADYYSTQSSCTDCAYVETSPADDVLRVRRGGSVVDQEYVLISTYYRTTNNANKHSPALGFRCAYDIK